MPSDDHNIPSIITTDLTTDDDDTAPPQLTTSPVQNLSPTTVGGLLAPHSPAGPRSSLDTSSSPVNDDGYSFVTVPPSPTLSSHSSVHFGPTSLALRDNKPELRSPSILLSPDGVNTHRRKGSNATFVSDTTTTEADHSLRPEEELRHVKSNTTSVTHVGSRSASRAKRDTADSEATTAISEKGSKPKKGAGPEEQTELDMTDTDPTPFHFRDGRPGAGVGVSHRHDPEKGEEPVPAITLTDPEGEKSTNWTSGPAFAASLDVRRRVYGENVLPRRATKSLLSLMYTALKDKVLVLLSIAAVVSLALGLFQDFGTPRPAGDPPVDWVEGVAIMVAILIVVVVGSVNDWQKERQFQTLNDKKEERGVKVIRGGVEKVIDIKEVVVGDIALLEPGEIVPCDGVFLGGHNVKCDESGATGESDAIKKLSYDECMALRGSGADAHTDCFVVSGSKVLEGVGRYVVVAVGTKSFNGRIMMALRGDADNTPLQLKLNALAELIAKARECRRSYSFHGATYPVFRPTWEGRTRQYLKGLPLAVTLALAFATKRMTYEKLLVRILGSCETMANASVVCTDKTGTLTQNVMTVVAGSVGIHGKFVRHIESNETRTNANDPNEAGVRKHANDFSVDQAQLSTILSPQLQTLFNEAIAVNSTAFEDTSPETGETIFVGSKTETALLQFAQELKWPSFRTTRDAATVIQMIPFSSERKAMGVVVKTTSWQIPALSEGRERNTVQEEGSGSGNPSGEIEIASIDELANDNITRTTIFYANQMLRTIALCYRDLDSWPPRDTVYNEDDEVAYEDLAHNLTLIGIVGIEDPLRPGVKEAVRKCQLAGVAIKMCTGDNVLTARSIALQCGIFSTGGVIMEGPVFRDLSPAEKMEIVPRLQVLARSSPEDKRILVETLKQIGEIVGVTGDGTNDGPALKTANVGFSMGIAGTEVAKEASDIILMDDNFASIVKAIMWGRCVNDASTYQIIITLVFHFAGLQILGYGHSSDAATAKKNDLIVQTLVFNAFVFAQIFNSVNCRRLDRNLNIFEGILKNWYFIIITLIEIAVQILIVFIGGAAFQVTRIGGREWGISLALGVVSIPLGVVIRLLPSDPFETLFKKLGLLGNPDVLPTNAPNPDTVGWNAITRVRDNLNTFANVRGGRVRSSSFVIKSRTARLSQEKERPVSLLAMAPTLMMGTIAASHAWTQPGSLSDPTNSDPSRSSAALWEESEVSSGPPRTLIMFSYTVKTMPPLNCKPGQRDNKPTDSSGIVV
ncbi:calcium-transporting ATPase [Mycena alexandri]|uniref:Calcium-transporting ATPase 2 n=1 Tax=Mycena alexandri TaxID=1745969 RepID=A0AAD6X7G0_9AGAR|nr:calcium-transporting ATPase [Mycena alexandri]